MLFSFGTQKTFMGDEVTKTGLTIFSDFHMH